MPNQTLNTRVNITNKLLKKGFSYMLKRFWILNWRIIVLLFLLGLSIWFIWWSNAQVDTNFIDTLK